MSESQQGPEICDIISRKRYFNSVCLIHLLLGGKKGGGLGGRYLLRITPIFKAHASRK